MNKNNVYFSAAVVGIFGFALSAFALSQDPLFSKMEGHWTGAGTNTYPLSGRVTQMSAVVTSTVSVVNGQERLTSDNQTTESSAGTTPQTYHSVYWIQAKPGQAGAYALGVDQASTSSGTLSIQGETVSFVSDQDLGNGYNIHSETQFNELGSLYTETTTNGTEVILKSVIQYQRAP